MGRTKRIARAELPALTTVFALLLAGCGGVRQADRAEDRVYVHTVGHEENLADIAEEYYGDPDEANRIAAFNAIEDETLEPGAVVRVPMTPEDIERVKVREQAREPYNRGIALAGNGGYIDAVQRFNEALAIDPEFTDAAYNLGVTYNKLRSYDRASEVLEDVVRRRPDKAKYRFALGNSYFYLKRYGDAVEAFEAVMELDPGHRKALFSMAVSLEKLERTRKAREAWQRYLELDSTSAWATEARKRLQKLGRP